ncbi:hypothetical protein MN210_13915 [Psychrobacter raelei]|uniref:Lipoprotein n=1 Tax=Psychrobacter raelei TaxID=2565531 RepID=A0AAT9PEY1_9GAMM|nr:hypothetical protein [Psychrobacter sp. PraFG1]UNK05091.1 hypothetical protein MN210_13915 [Psychrobacter sp. PraFG1]
MTINNKSLKLTVWIAALTAVLGLTACQKQEQPAPAQDEEAEVAMSAEPAEGNDPAIVADDLDDVDARSANADEAAADVAATDVDAAPTAETPAPADVDTQSEAAAETTETAPAQ